MAETAQPSLEYTNLLMAIERVMAPHKQQLRDLPPGGELVVDLGFEPSALSHNSLLNMIESVTGTLLTCVINGSKCTIRLRASNYYLRARE